MHAFYLAFTVERIRSKDKEKLNQITVREVQVAQSTEDSTFYKPISADRKERSDSNWNRKIFNIRFVAVVILVIAIAGSSIYYFSTPSPDVVYKKNKKAIVLINAYDFGGNQIKLGTGFIVSKDGIIATNNHVINNSAGIDVKTIDDRVLTVEGILYVDEEKDIALLKIKTSKEYELPTLHLGDSNQVKVGEKVYAIGNPVGLENTFSEGLVSGVREIGENINVIQITAAISSGSSGGPVLDKKGEVIGIASFIITKGQNLNFAVPINTIKDTMGRRLLLYTLPSRNPKWDTLFVTDISKRENVYNASVGLLIDENSAISISKSDRGVWLFLRYFTEPKPKYAKYPAFQRQFKKTKDCYLYTQLNCSTKKFRYLLQINVDKDGKIIDELDENFNFITNKEVEWSTVRIETQNKFNELCAGYN